MTNVSAYAPNYAGSRSTTASFLMFSPAVPSGSIDQVLQLAHTARPTQATDGAEQSLLTASAAASAAHPWAQGHASWGAG